MSMEFKFPDLGEGVTEGEIKKWLVKEGDLVKKDQSIAEVETDKAIVEMPSPYSGRMGKISFPEGGIVKVGEVLATIEEGEEGEPAGTGSVSVVGELPVGEEIVVSSRPEVKAPAAVQATPAVRRLARDLGVDISAVKGTGPEGRVVENDIRGAGAVTEKPTVPKVQPKFDLYGWVERRPLRGVRRAVAKHMMEAQSKAALVTTQDTADVTELVALREKVKDQVMESKGVKLTYLPFIMKAVIAALQRNPVLNSSMDEETGEIVIKKYYNLGVAVATEDGLMVPVVKATDQKDIIALAAELKTLSEAANERKVDLADLKGGTFSITNYGVFGGTFATPIPNHPEAAILGTGRIYDAPRIVDGEVRPRKVLDLSLTFDHRIMDGAEAARFLTDLRRFLESPELLLLGI